MDDDQLQSAVLAFVGGFWGLGFWVLGLGFGFRVSERWGAGGVGGGGGGGGWGRGGVGVFSKCTWRFRVLLNPIQ